MLSLRANRADAVRSNLVEYNQMVACNSRLKPATVACKIHVFLLCDQNAKLRDPGVKIATLGPNM